MENAISQDIFDISDLQWKVRKWIKVNINNPMQLQEMFSFIVITLSNPFFSIRLAWRHGKRNKNAPNGVSSSKMLLLTLQGKTYHNSFSSTLYSLFSFCKPTRLRILMKSATWQGKLSQIEVKNRDRSRRFATARRSG